MINFQDLALPQGSVKAIQKQDRIRYIIGCDPFDNVDIEEGYSIYTVYDKIIQRITTVCKSKKTLHEFAKKFVDSTDEITKNYIISDKFIGETGKAKRFSYARD